MNVNTCDPVVRLDDVVRRYPRFQLGPLSLELEPGRVLVVLGANGAGKSTLLRCIAGVTRLDSGSMELHGAKPAFVSGRYGFYRRWTVSQNLRFVSRFFDGWSHDDATELARRLELPLDARVAHLSQGGLSKLGLVAALSHRPELLLLDEPTQGLDPMARAELFDILRERQEDDRNAVVLVTHMLSDVSRLADELAVLNEGKIIARGSPVDLLDAWRRISYRLPDSTGDAEIASHDVEGALAQLRHEGALNIEASPMSIEEIALEILKQPRS